MAVHKPSTGVVGGESDDKPAAARENGDIAAGRIGKFQLREMRRN